jgi:hypothetical protein
LGWWFDPPLSAGLDRWSGLAEEEKTTGPKFNGMAVHCLVWRRPEDVGQHINVATAHAAKVCVFADFHEQQHAALHHRSLATAHLLQASSPTSSGGPSPRFSFALVATMGEIQPSATSIVIQGFVFLGGRS